METCVEHPDCTQKDNQIENQKAHPKGVDALWDFPANLLDAAEFWLKHFLFS